jgi:hypothetical protein
VIIKMDFYNIEQNNSDSIKVSRYADGKLLRETSLVKGRTYIISPDDLRKKKNRGRKCILLEFEGSPIMAKVLYPDTGRRGKVELEDLVDIVAEEEVVELSPVKGVEISGSVFAHEGDVDHEEFQDSFINFIESKGWFFGGSTKQIDEDGNDKKFLGDNKV